MSDDVPDFNTITTAAVAMHEMFTSLLEAGFTEEQALRILIGVARQERDQ